MRSQGYINQHMFKRDAEKHALREIVRTTEYEWIEPFLEQVNNLTGLKVNCEQGANGGRCWSNALFPTKTDQPYTLAFWHSRAVFLLKINGKRFAHIKYRLSRTPSVSFNTSNFAHNTCNSSQVRVEALVDLTYPMFGFTTAPPLWEITDIRDALLRYLLRVNAIQDSVAKAKCLQTIGELNKASDICLNTYDTALTAIEGLKSQISHAKSILEEWDSAHLLEKSFQDETCDKKG
jgi:hypothetical protein